MLSLLILIILLVGFSPNVAKPLGNGDHFQSFSTFNKLAKVNFATHMLFDSLQVALNNERKYRIFNEAMRKYIRQNGLVTRRL